MTDQEPVHFDAELRQIKSMADGTYNLVLNVPEYQLEQIRIMMGWLRSQVGIAAIEIKIER